MDRLIVGLRNPGNKYESTRHNIGDRVLLELDSTRSANWQKKFKGFYTTATSSHGKVIFLRPETFMNLSGESVQPAAKFFKIESENILILHDELDLPYGTVAFKKGGGLAGHNGLKSISACLGTKDFLRMRIGIGRPERESVSSWVLSDFDSEQRVVFQTYMDLCRDAVQEFIDNGWEKAASNYSRKNIVY